MENITAQTLIAFMAALAAAIFITYGVIRRMDREAAQRRAERAEAARREEAYLLNKNTKWSD